MTCHTLCWVAERKNRSAVFGPCTALHSTLGVEIEDLSTIAECVLAGACSDVACFMLALRVSNNA